MFHVLCGVKQMELQVLHLARLIIPETKFENPQILYALIDMSFFIFGSRWNFNVGIIGSDVVEPIPYSLNVKLGCIYTERNGIAMRKLSFDITAA